jgi:hypothetical protein
MASFVESIPCVLRLRDKPIRTSSGSQEQIPHLIYGHAVEAQRTEVDQSRRMAATGVNAVGQCNYTLNALMHTDP